MNCTNDHLGGKINIRTRSVEHAASLRDSPVRKEKGLVRYGNRFRARSIVRCFREATTSRTDDVADAKGRIVKRLPKHLKGVKGNVKSSLRYVLAAPIWNEDGSIWGVVDFDASSEAGRKRLQSNVSRSVILRLAGHLSRVPS